MFCSVRLIGTAFLGYLACAAPPQQIVQPGSPGRPSQVISNSAANLAPPVTSKADIEFMQAMIVHHSQAVEMVELLEKRGSSPALKTLGRRITISQADEVEWMRQWLRERGQSTEMGSMMHHHHSPGMDMSKMASGDVPIMSGMLSPNQMKTLAAASGRAFDQLFLTGMIQHHTGALDMVADLLAVPGAGQDNALFDFLTDVDNTQSAEIQIMETMLAKTAASKRLVPRKSGLPKKDKK